MARDPGAGAAADGGIYAALADRDVRYVGPARQRIAALRATTDPQLASFRQAADLLVARRAQAKGHGRPLNALVDAMTDRVDRPMLVYAPVVDLETPSACGATNIIYIYKDYLANPIVGNGTPGTDIATQQVHIE